MSNLKALIPPENAGGGNNDNNLQLLIRLYPGRVTLTVKELADVLAKSDDFVYERLASGDIRGTRTGRNWVIPLPEAARLLNEGVK